MVDLIPHSFRPDRTINIELLAGFQQLQGHLPRLGILLRVVRVRYGWEQQVWANGDISIRKHLLRFLPSKLNVLFHIAPQRRADEHQLGAGLFPFRHPFPEHGQILPDGLPEGIVIRSRGMIGIPVHISAVIPQVSQYAAAEVRIAGFCFHELFQYTAAERNCQLPERK